MLPFSMIRRRSTPRHSFFSRCNPRRSSIFLRVHAGNAANPFLSCGYFITCGYPGGGGLLPFSAISAHGACSGLVRALKPTPASASSLPRFALPFAGMFLKPPASLSVSGPLPFNKISPPLNSLVATLPQVFIPNNLKSFICNAYKKSEGEGPITINRFPLFRCHSSYPSSHHARSPANPFLSSISAHFSSQRAWVSRPALLSLPLPYSAEYMRTYPCRGASHPIKMELANLLGQGQRSEHNSQRNKKLDRRQTGRRSRMAGVAAPEFPALLQRAEHFADWHVDDAHRHELAGL